STGYILTQFETSSGNTAFQLGNRGDIFAYRGKVSGTFGSWLTVASRDWVTSQIPSVGNGTLTLNTGTGLSGGTTFTANQSGNSTFTVAAASGYSIPTNTQISNWNTAYGWG